MLLRPFPSAVPLARAHARLAAAEWDIHHLRDTAELLAAELVANAVTASEDLPGRPGVRLELRSDHICLLVLVHDASPRPPAPVAAGDWDEGGRGLMLVDALAARWGCAPDIPAGGKTCWCLIEGERPVMLA